MLSHGVHRDFEDIYKELVESLGDRAKAFAAENPDYAYFLGNPSTDPDVERLIEGNAYIAAQVVQLLDSRLPELTHTLVDLFFPQFLRPFPPCTMLEFRPNPGVERYQVPRGFRVSSEEVEGTTCEFRTAFGMNVLPFQIRSARLLDNQLEITFDVAAHVRLAECAFNQIRLHVQQSEVFHWMCRHADQIRVTHINQTEIPSTEQIPLELSMVGFSETESLIPDAGPFSPSGFRLFMEYFAFPDKFKFVDLVSRDARKGWEQLRELAAAHPTKTNTDDFTVMFYSAHTPGIQRVRSGEIRLNCTPAINLFETTVSLEINQRKAEYLIPKPSHNEIYSVDSVEPVFGRQPIYEPLHTCKPDRDWNNTVYYQVHFRPALTDPRAIDTYISFVTPPHRAPLPQPDRVIVHLTCTNWRRAQRLNAGQIFNTKDLRQFKNIMGVTASPRLPLEPSLHWQLIAHLGQNRRSIVDRTSLQHVLSLCNFYRDGQVFELNRRRLNGLESVKPRRMNRLMDDGRMIYGTALDVQFRRGAFIDDGDLLVFASVLSHFLSDYASVNSFVQLIATDERGESILCPNWFQPGKKKLL